MPPDQTAPQDPQEGTSNPPSTPTPPQTPNIGGVDIGNILLPKKEKPGTTLQSAARGDAGELLKRESAATLPVTPKPVVAPVPKKEETVVKSLQTYQGDIEAMVANKNTSVVGMAAAEAERRSAASQSVQTEPRAWISKTLSTALIMLGVVFIVGALGSIAYVLRPAPSVEIPVDAPAPFIFVDETYGFSVPLASFKRSTAMNALEDQRQRIALSLGLIGRIYLAVPSAVAGEGTKPLSVLQLLSVLAPSAPDVLLRSLDPYEYLLGVHSYDENQALLILRTRSYEQTFAGMLSWEASMRQDLLPFFNRVPPVSTNTDGIAPTNDGTGFVSNQFTDKIIENHDARVVQNAVGDTLLLWSFVDRNTLVITTNEATFREIISRLKNAPIIPEP